MRQRSRLIAISAALALALPGLAIPAVAGAQCLEQVDALAATLGMSTTLPQPSDLAADDATDSGATDGDAAVAALAESDGVIAPPPSGDNMPVLEPSAGQTSDMETAPDIDAQPAPDAADATDAGDPSTTGMQVEALLTAARQAAETGDEEACLARLQEATALAAANELPLPE